MNSAQLVLTVLVVYLGVGALVGPAFVFVAANKSVGGARESGIVFRLFVLPAAIVLWPLILGSIPRLKRGEAQ
ncbi:MAG: hypothetical protein AAFY60_20180 [Myxococcota bacterium]